MDKRPGPRGKPSPSFRWVPKPAGFRRGQSLHDHLELKEDLGFSGFCEVWHARDSRTKQDILLKVVPAELTAQVAIDARLQAEVRHAEVLDHPNILKLLHVLHDNTWTAVLTEDLVAHPISALMAKEDEGYFEAAAIRKWVGQLCEALIHAHEDADLVHGDLKLSNLAIDGEGNLKVSDFLLDRSLAQWADKNGYPAEPPGSEAYSSPQIFAGKTPTIADDVYSLGACLFALLTGHAPYVGDDIRRQVQSIIPESPTKRRRTPGKPIPAAWEQVIASCLHKDPTKRPASVRKLAEKLGFKPPRTRRKKPAFSFSWTRKYSQTALIAGGVILFLLLASAGGGAWYRYVHLPAEKARVEKIAREQEEARLREEARRQAEEEEKIRKQADSVREEAEKQRLALEAAEQHRQQQEAARRANARGSVRITTQPPGARVSIDFPGLDPLSSPALFPKVPPGKQNVAIELAGYDPVTLVVEVREGAEAGPAPIVLVRQKGTVRIQSTPPGAEVFAGDKPLGITPLVLTDTPTGPVAYQIRMKGYESQDLQGKVFAGRESLLGTVLKRRQGPPSGTDFTNSAGLRMVWIPPLGCWVAREETTQEQFFALLRSNPSQFQGDRNPVERVTWQEAQQFCRELTMRELQAGRLGSGMRYRLPTEAEWQVFVGDARLQDAVTGMGAGPAVDGPQVVGSKGPNQFGLVDVRGNVAEWCEDAYQGKSDMRILRGGSWLSRHAESMAVESRDYSGIGERGNNRGFRCILVYDGP